MGELGQRGIRYVTGVVMDGALRAPGLMADIVQTGQLGLEQRGRSGSLHQQQRQQNESYQLAPEARLGDLDMSDDDTVPAAPGQIVEVHTDEVDSQSQDSGEPMQVEELDQAGPRRRRKKVAASADASFSSGGEDEDPDFQLPSISKNSRGGKGGGTAKKSTAATTTRKSTRRAKQQ